MIFLGTGASEAIPNPFCTCEVCRKARTSRDHREKRGRSAFSIDEENLIDFDFENSVFEVDGYLKGIIRLGSAVWMILPLLVDIRIWRTIKDIKAFKKKIDHSKEVITKGGQAA